MNRRIVAMGHIVALGVFALIGLLLVNQQNYAGSHRTANQQNSNSKVSRDSNLSGNGAQSTTSGGLSSADRKFVMEAAMGGMAEVELGQRAAQQGSSDAVRQFGKRMADDHSKANSELMTVASSKGITLPTELDAKHRAKIAKMAKLSGAAFDSTYAREMVSDHNKDIAAFQKESTGGGDAEVKAFASKTLPTLEEHQRMANEMNQTINGTSKSNANSGGNTNSNGNSNRP